MSASFQFSGSDATYWSTPEPGPKGAGFCEIDGLQLDLEVEQGGERGAGGSGVLDAEEFVWSQPCRKGAGAVPSTERYTTRPSCGRATSKLWAPPARGRLLRHSSVRYSSPPYFRTVL